MSKTKNLPPPRFELKRSEGGYGWWLWLFRRIRYTSPAGRTPMRPHIKRSHDEKCNPVLDIHLWPLGGLDIWWHPGWRTEICDACKAEYDEEGVCYECGSRPCYCNEGLVTCDGCDNTSESGWGDTPFCLNCEQPANICPEHQRTFVGSCPLDHPVSP